MAQVRQQFPLMQTLVGQHLAGAAEQTRNAVEVPLAAITDIVQQEVAPHADAPDRLEADRDLAVDLSTSLTDLGPQLTELSAADGWHGDAADTYRRAATTQASALTEYAGLVASSANALDRAALLNRSTFFYTAEAIRFAASRIAAISSPSAFALYPRSRAASGELHALASKLVRELSEIKGGVVAQTLADELDRALDVPALLTGPTWPTGGDASATQPAATEVAVRPPSRRSLSAIRTLDQRPTH